MPTIMRSDIAKNLFLPCTFSTDLQFDFPWCSECGLRMGGKDGVDMRRSFGGALLWWFEIDICSE